MSSSISLSVISPNCHLPEQIVDCPSDWTVVDLKRNLAEVYPGNPKIEEQRLIFSGQLMGDDTLLASLFDKNPISRTIHLVLDPSANKKATMLVNSYTSNRLPRNDDADQLKKDYAIYVEEFHQKYQKLNMDEQENRNCKFIEHVLQVLNNGVEPPPQPQNDFPVANVQPNPDRPNILQRFARLFGNFGVENADEVANVEGQDDGFDFIEFTYTIFRISLMVTICVAYSSWQRMLLVGFVAAFFYLHNLGRRNRQHVEPVQLPRLIPAPVQPQAVPANQPNGIQIPTNSNGETNEVNEPTMKIDNKIVSESIPEEAPPQVESPIVVIQPTNALRFIALTSLRFLYALVSSLVPELPVQLE